MKKLFESWRTYKDNLKEGMKTPRDLKSYEGQIHVHVEITPDQGAKIFYTDENHNKLSDVHPVFGKIYIGKTDGSDGNCEDAWEVHYVRAKKGWGPLLYEIALEIASQEAGGLVPDRYAVSEDAQKVWEYYYSRREDVEKSQLDDLQNTLTPINTDNCLQKMSKNVDHFPKGALSLRYYKKEPEAVKALQNMELIMFTEY